jgi:hypothetical protein
MVLVGCQTPVAGFCDLDAALLDFVCNGYQRGLGGSADPGVLVLVGVGGCLHGAGAGV